MRNWLAILGAVVMASLPLVAQHASSASRTGGMSGHFSSAPAGRSSSISLGRPSAPSAPRMATAPAPRYGGTAYGNPRGRPARAVNSGSHARAVAANASRSRSGGTSYGHGKPGRQGSNGHGSNQHVRLYAYGVSPVGWWLGPWQFYPWLDADLSYDFWHDTGDADTAVAMASTGADMVEDAAPHPWPNGGDPNSDLNVAQSDDNAPRGWQATQIDTGTPALTLIYKSGQTEQVLNYVVSRTAVTVIDDHGVRSVPVDELDVNQMAKVNAQAGLTLPGALQP